MVATPWQRTFEATTPLVQFPICVQATGTSVAGIGFSGLNFNKNHTSQKDVKAVDVCALIVMPN